MKFTMIKIKTSMTDFDAEFLFDINGKKETIGSRDGVWIFNFEDLVWDSSTPVSHQIWFVADTGASIFHEFSLDEYVGQYIIHIERNERCELFVVEDC